MSGSVLLGFKRKKSTEKGTATKRSIIAQKNSLSSSLSLHRFSAFIITKLENPARQRPFCGTPI